jgi:hypothetical protein
MNPAAASYRREEAAPAALKKSMISLRWRTHFAGALMTVRTVLGWQLVATAMKPVSEAPVLRQIVRQENALIC